MSGMLSRKSKVRKGTTAVSVACVLSGLANLAGSSPASADSTDWVQLTKNDSLAIFARPHAGCLIKEIRAVGPIDAPNWVVKNVIDGVEDYPSFMPYTTKTTVIERKLNQIISYFRLDPPFIGARDITVSVSSQTQKHEDGTTSYQLHWEPVNSLGPSPSPGVIRITLDQGSWSLEPADGGKKTMATYTILTDAGGGLPAFVINFANRQGVENLFSAIRKQIGLTKYSQNRPGD
jgi:Polyketide cyclase / dehydrase and lipid transport